jgi:hypothetical protein
MKEYALIFRRWEITANAKYGEIRKKGGRGEINRKRERLQNQFTGSK